MNLTPEQLTEQTIAAFAANRKDPRTPRQRSQDGGKTWQDCHPYMEARDWGSDYHYRIAPFTLGNSINGHTLGEGEQWHRVGGWTADMLPAPYRPLLSGEKLVHGEPFRYKSGMNAKVDGIAGDATEDHPQCHFTTTRPLPSAQLAPGSNPDRLTCAQVGTKDGWRLLEVDEIKRRSCMNKIERWSDGAWDSTAWGGEMPNRTYRTRLTREELAALDAPKEPQFRAWNCAEDVPFPWPLIRQSCDDGIDSIIRIEKRGIRLPADEGNAEGLWTWEELRDFTQSIDGGKTWQLCKVQV